MVPGSVVGSGRQGLPSPIAVMRRYRGMIGDTIMASSHFQEPG
jgi:hypothetical protein